MTSIALAPPVLSSSTTPVGVVLVHGMRCAGSMWDTQAALLRDAGHAVAPVDLPGHGDRHGDRFTFPGAFDALDDAVAGLPGELPVVLVGHSLGGYVSLAWAARDGERGAAGARSAAGLAGVVVSGCSTDPHGKPLALYRDVAAQVVRAGSRVRRRFGGLRTGVASGTGSRDGAGAPALPRPGWDLVTDALTELAGRSSVADVSAVQAPVWLVNGARDHLRWQEQRHLRAARRGALVVVPRAGHDVPLDAPVAYHQVLARALGDLAHV